MKYLIAVDASDNSRFAFRHAKKNFFTEKDHVYILTVTENPSSYPFEDIFNFSRETYNEMNLKIENMFSDLLKQYGRELTRAGIPHTCLIARGTIRDVICRQAIDLCVDIVILGRRGMGTLERAFIGSTSQYCVHNLNCSVIVIPFTAKDKLSPTTSEEIVNMEEEYEKLDEGRGEGRYIINKKGDQPESGSEEFSREESRGIQKEGSCRNPQCHNPSCNNPNCQCRDPECTSAGCQQCQSGQSKFSKIGQYEREKWGSIKGDEKSDISGTKEDFKYEGGAGKFERMKVPSGGEGKVSENKGISSGKQECLECKSDHCEVHGKWQGLEKGEMKEKKGMQESGNIQGKSEKSGTKEDLKYEGGAGKFERMKVPSGGEGKVSEHKGISSGSKQEGKSDIKSDIKSDVSKQECKDPQCRKEECVKHGKWQGKVHEKSDKPQENKGKGSDVNEGSYAQVSGGKSYAEVVSKSSKSGEGEKSSEHKAGVNVGAGKVEGSVQNKKDEEGKWKETKVDVGYKGKDEKGQEYQGKKFEASIESK